MKRIFKLLILIVTLNYNLFGCSLCVLDIPIVSTYTEITKNSNQTNFNVRWEFNDKFTQSISMYDENQDGLFDTKELRNVQLTLEDYLKTTNYLTDIFYESKEIKYSLEKLREFRPTSTSISIKKNIIIYNFSFSLNLELKQDYLLFIQFQDMGNNFNFQFKDIVLKNYNNFKIIEPLENSANIYLYDKSEIVEAPKEKKINKTEVIKEEKNNDSFIELLSEQLGIYKTKIELLLKDIKENNSLISYFWLLLFSFLYGIIHAIGPGHGKSLVAAYFLTQDRSYIKAFNISLLIGVVHTFSAFILTLVIYYVLNVLLSNYFQDIEYIATKLSAVIIILIALSLIYKKIKSSKPNNKFSIHNPNAHSCSCSGCKTTSNDLSVVIAAGIVPCPGTVTIFIFTFGLGIYFVGFLSAIFMSLGMSLIIFIMSYLSIKIKTKSQNNNTLIRFFEYGSLVFILLLGLSLLII